MDLNSYTIKELENIDFRTSNGKKIKLIMGISTNEAKQKINELILKKKKNTNYQDMIQLLPDEKINIRKHSLKEFEKKKQNIDFNIHPNIDLNIHQNIDLTMNPNIDLTMNQNIDLTMNPNIDLNIHQNIDLTMNPNQNNIQIMDNEINNVNYIVQLINSDDTIQLKLNREEFINFAINNGYSQEFILHFLNQGNKTNICKIDDYQWLNETFFKNLHETICNTPVFFDSELELLNQDKLYDTIYQQIVEDIEENKRRSIEEMKEINNEQLETLKNQYNTINTIKDRLNNRFQEYKNRDILKECDLLKKDIFFDMIKELNKITDLRIRLFLTHYRYNCIHNRQRNVIDKIVRILIPPPQNLNCIEK